MKLLIDNQLPPALARLIDSELGCEAAHVTDIGLRDASDADIWAYVRAREIVLVSKDDDFAHIVLRESGGKLLWVRTGNCRRAVLLQLFRTLWPIVLERLESGDRLIEIG